jgi:hypothetical protein
MLTCVLQIETTPIWTGRADTSDVPNSQACRVMPSVVQLVLIDVVIPAINYELLL